MTWKLMVDRGRQTGQTIPLAQPTLLIGRGEDCHLRPASEAVSRLHCRLTLRDNRLFVADCLATNGTFVNGERLAGEQELQPGDRLGIGPLVFVVEFTSSPVPAPAPPVDDDTVAAMLLEMDHEEDPAAVGWGESAANPDAETAAGLAPAEQRPDQPADSTAPRQDSARAAEAILDKYIRRPGAAGRR
jgi:pSer/pThr/pTyr-binding forkhead associated (FHA) protein